MPEVALWRREGGESLSATHTSPHSTAGNAIDWVCGVVGQRVKAIDWGGAAVKGYGLGWVELPHPPHTIGRGTEDVGNFFGECKT